jgi:DNA gyrase subunit B
MQEIIHRGHLFIAQPPLYKITEGRKDTYLKDDREYHSFLVERIKDAWEVEMVVDGESKSLKGARLAQFLDAVEGLGENLERLASRGYPADALRVALLQGLVDRDSFADLETMERVAHIIEASGFHDVAVSRDEEYGTGILTFVSRRDGVERAVRFDRDLLASAEYRAMARNKVGLEALAASSYGLLNGDVTESELTQEEVLERLFAGAKKGLGVQRYKGLGEMNAEQLWETTMDPEKRSLLQVTIEDDVGADQIFSTLMGDQVEPRREFIENNALNVRNLDV